MLLKLNTYNHVIVTRVGDDLSLRITSVQIPIVWSASHVHTMLEWSRQQIWHLEDKRRKL
jgi:hypothetical protein